MRLITLDSISRPGTECAHRIDMTGDIKRQAHAVRKAQDEDNDAGRDPRPLYLHNLGYVPDNKPHWHDPDTGLSLLRKYEQERRKCQQISEQINNPPLVILDGESYPTTERVKSATALR